MKIINVSKTRYEFTWDGKVQPYIMPGQIVDLPDEVAYHAIKRSAVIDDLGEVECFKIEMLDRAKDDPERLAKLISYTCPLADTGLCEGKTFKNQDELKAHMNSVHWGPQATTAPKPEMTVRK